MKYQLSNAISRFREAYSNSIYRLILPASIRVALGNDDSDFKLCVAACKLNYDEVPSFANGLKMLLNNTIVSKLTEHLFILDDENIFQKLIDRRDDQSIYIDILDWLHSRSWLTPDILEAVSGYMIGKSCSDVYSLLTSLESTTILQENAIENLLKIFNSKHLSPESLESCKLISSEDAAENLANLDFICSQNSYKIDILGFLHDNGILNASSREAIMNANVKDINLYVILAHLCRKNKQLFAANNGGQERFVCVVKNCKVLIEDPVYKLCYNLHVVTEDSFNRIIELCEKYSDEPTALVNYLEGSQPPPAPEPSNHQKVITELSNILISGSGLDKCKSVLSECYPNLDIFDKIVKLSGTDKLYAVRALITIVGLGILDRAYGQLIVDKVIQSESKQNFVGIITLLESKGLLTNELVSALRVSIFFLSYFDSALYTLSSVGMLDSSFSSEYLELILKCSSPDPSKMPMVSKFLKLLHSNNFFTDDNIDTSLETIAHWHDMPYFIYYNAERILKPLNTLKSANYISDENIQDIFNMFRDYHFILFNSKIYSALFSEAGMVVFSEQNWQKTIEIIASNFDEISQFDTGSADPVSDSIASRQIDDILSYVNRVNSSYDSEQEHTSDILMTNT